jgi:hypothetical protein
LKKKIDANRYAKKMSKFNSSINCTNCGGIGHYHTNCTSAKKPDEVKVLFATSQAKEIPKQTEKTYKKKETKRSEVNQVGSKSYDNADEGWTITNGKTSKSETMVDNGCTTTMFNDLSYFTSYSFCKAYVYLPKEKGSRVIYLHSLDYLWVIQPTHLPTKFGMEQKLSSPRMLNLMKAVSRSSLIPSRQNWISMNQSTGGCPLTNMNQQIRSLLHPILDYNDLMNLYPNHLLRQKTLQAMSLEAKVNMNHLPISNLAWALIGPHKV